MATQQYNSISMKIESALRIPYGYKQCSKTAQMYTKLTDFERQASHRVTHVGG